MKGRNREVSPFSLLVFTKNFRDLRKILRFYLILIINSFSIILGRSNHTKEVVRMNEDI